MTDLAASCAVSPAFFAAFLSIVSVFNTPGLAPQWAQNFSASSNAISALPTSFFQDACAVNCSWGIGVVATGR